MSKTIPAVPESITRADYVALIESLGLTARDLTSLRFENDGIYAEVIERDADGDPRATSSGYAKSTVYIPVEG